MTPDARGRARLRARPGHRGELGGRRGQGVHEHRRQGLHHRDRRLRPHRQGGHARPAARHRLLVPLLRPAAPTPRPPAPAPPRPPTPPSPGVRFGVVSCANWEAGYFSAYRHLAARGDLDAWLHLGDYIYEYGTGEYADARAPSYARTRPPTRSSRSPTTAPGTAVQDRPRPSGPARRGPGHRDLGRPRVRQRRLVGRRREPHRGRGGRPGRPAQAAAKQAYFEWMPVRAGDRGHHLPPAALRQARRPLAARPALLPLAAGRRSATATVDDPDRTLTGRAQLDWLKAGLAGLRHHLAAGRQLGDDLAVRHRLALRRPAGAARRAAGPAARRASPSTPTSGTATPTTAANSSPTCADERDPQHGLPHRRHPHGVGQRRAGQRRYVPAVAPPPPPSSSSPRSPPTTSTTSSRSPRAPSPRSPRPLIRAANRHVHWVDTDRHGYGVLDITAERAQMDYYVLSDRTKHERDGVLGPLVPHAQRHAEGRAGVRPGD